MKTNKQALFFALFIIISVYCWASGNKDKGTATQAEQQTQTVQQTVPHSEQPPAPLYWTGDGGRGQSITILPPKGTGLTENLLEVIAVELVSNFTQYSAMTVFDRVNNQRQYDELLSGYYADDDPAGLDLGHLATTDYMLLGNITRTSTSYVLQLSINSNREKTTVAVYSETVQINVLENLTAVRQASLDLLQKIGIQNTQLARTELTRTATTEQINARTLTAQGISAQRGGTVVEAMTYYYEATAFDPTLLEAANRASVLSATITSGNIGENVRNDIQWRNEWKKILDEAEDFFSRHLPFEIVYDPTLTQGGIDYNRETVDLSFRLNITTSPTAFKVLNDLRRGLVATGKIADWGFRFWPFTGGINGVMKYHSTNTGFGKNITIEASLINENGMVISRTGDRFEIFLDIADEQGRIGRSYYSTYSSDRSAYDRCTRIINVYPNVIRTLRFNDVKANDITDRLTVQIVSVDGITAGNIARQGYISIYTGTIR